MEQKSLFNRNEKNSKRDGSDSERKTDTGTGDLDRESDPDREGDPDKKNDSGDKETNSEGEAPGETESELSADSEKSQEGHSRGPGRPPKRPSERRSKSHGLKLKPAEKEELERRAREAGVSINKYLRRTALGGEPLRPDRQVLQEIISIRDALAELRRIAREKNLPEVERLVAETLSEVEAKFGRML
jgi:hypothetical protein